MKCHVVILKHYSRECEIKFRYHAPNMHVVHQLKENNEVTIQKCGKPSSENHHKLFMLTPLFFLYTKVGIELFVCLAINLDYL